MAKVLVTRASAADGGVGGLPACRAVVSTTDSFTITLV